MDRVYYYTFKKGIFKVEEGIVTIVNGVFGHTFVYFKPLDNPKRLTNYEGIHEKVLGKGLPHIWMTERDDELARQLFIEYEESIINVFLSKIEDKKKLIEILKKTRV